VGVKQIETLNEDCYIVTHYIEGVSLRRKLEKPIAPYDYQKWAN
jgi:hypothetical protein